MCFSEHVSFGTAIALGVMGVVALKEVKGEKKYYPLALIPLFFAFQQFGEGMQWLYFKGIWGDEKTAAFGRDLFLLVAYGLWPTFIPFSVLLPETNEKLRRPLKVLLVLGLLISAYNLFQYFTTPLASDAVESSIQYTVLAPKIQVLFYSACVVLPFIFSSMKYARPLGIFYAFSIPLSAWFYYNSFVSVWCFFSAVVSLFVILLLRNRHVRA